MSADKGRHHSEEAPHTQTDNRPAYKRALDLFSTPAPLRKLFAKVPVRTYEPNPLPARSPRSSKKHTLYLFSSEEDASAGRPSYNPRCLKWQAYLHFCGVAFQLQSSNNHASPTGVLPFLITGEQPKSAVIASGKLQKWADNNQSVKNLKPIDARHEAYLASLDHEGAIRRAWLYFLYLSPPNRTLLHRLYISDLSNNTSVQLTSSHHLIRAARLEISESPSSLYGPDPIDVQELLQQARTAFEGLATLLGDNKWFTGESEPGLLDAAVFSYTHLILDDTLGRDCGWADDRLGQTLRNFQNLCAHRQRTLDQYFAGEENY